VRAIADLAIASARVDTFRSALLDRLGGFVGFDSGMIFTAGEERATTWNKDAKYVRLLFAGTVTYAPEMEPLATAAARSGGVCVDADVFTDRERAKLRVYREVIAPQGIQSLLHAHITVNGRDTVICLARHANGSGRFRDEDADAMRRLVPTIQLGESLCAAREVWVGEPSRRSDEATLSRRERQVASLVARGLRNQDVAVMCGTSVHTVRKQLVSIFQKLGVASRTELVARLARPPEGGDS
jgi:DNA-binding CsgD family transcriptional regulator